MARTLELKESQTLYLTALDTAIHEGETIILKRGGQSVAVLMSIEAYEALQARPIAPPPDPREYDLEKDRAAFLRLKDELFRTHPGQYVGFRDGEFIDSDSDWTTLVERIYERFGYVPICVKKVEAQEPIYRISGPRRVS